MRKTLPFFTFLLLTSWAQAQLTDDSSKLVYSAKTTRIIHENDLKNNAPKERHPDTTLYRLEDFTTLDILSHKYQDLGNNGTAMFPVFYPIPDQIGRTSGFIAYDPYLTKPVHFQYFDSKSPFIDLTVVFGGQGRSVVDFGFTQNVNENWNIGLDLFRITSDKQIGRSGQGDRNSIGSIYNLHTYYKHPELPYSMLFHTQQMIFNVEETGGIYLEDLNTATAADLFEYQDSDIQLDEARLKEQRANWHLYHQYEWTKPLQFYHQLDIKNQTIGYTDFRGASGGQYDPYSDFYNRFLLDTDSTYERFIWREMVNEVGIKGDLANLFYRAYLKRRDMDPNYLYVDPSDRFSEMFLGGYTRFDWREKFNVEARAEFLQSGEYVLEGNLNSELIFGLYKTMRYKPAFIYERNFGNHHEWSRAMESAFTNEISGGIKLDLGFVKIRPTLRLVSMDKFFYFDQNIMPQQSGSVALMASTGGNFDFKITTDKANGKAFHWENEVYVSSVTGTENLRVPPVFYNGRFFWRGAWFKNTMGVELGLNIHAKTGYYAHAFAPEIQQFYLQDEFFIDSFWTADAFFAMRVNNVRAFIKFTNANQPNNGGYFISPYYPGQARVMDFGVRWLFFD